MTLLAITKGRRLRSAPFFHRASLILSFLFKFRRDFDQGSRLVETPKPT